ncbi:hypothetical protein [Candidatus Endomicrobiellum cubanum]
MPLLAPLFWQEVGFVTMARVGKSDAKLEILEIRPCDAVKFF